MAPFFFRNHPTAIVTKCLFYIRIQLTSSSNASSQWGFSSTIGRCDLSIRIQALSSPPFNKYALLLLGYKLVPRASRNAPCSGCCTCEAVESGSKRKSKSSSCSSSSSSRSRSSSSSSSEARRGDTPRRHASLFRTHAMRTPRLLFEPGTANHQAERRAAASADWHTRSCVSLGGGP